MSLRKRLAAHQQDERERYYYARAGQWAFVVMSFACVLLGLWYLVRGQMEPALGVIPVLALGQVVYFALLLRSRVTR
ncbi:MAG: hypothetical protein GX557_03840 [Chloroflexi bacterium]|nr:hypothetical protein [Chloroflexota bacterium]